MTGIIYKATSPDGRVYVGQTQKTLLRRKSQHAFRAKRGDKKSAFQVALLEYDFSAFTWEQIDTFHNAEELEQKEKFWIDHYKSDDSAHGYNGTDGGVNYIPTAETLKKISKALTGKKRAPFSADTRRRMSESELGEKNHNAKLTEAQVCEIKIALSAGEKGIQLAKKYGVSRDIISKIKCGKSWVGAKG